MAFQKSFGNPGLDVDLLRGMSINPDLIGETCFGHFFLLCLQVHVGVRVSEVGDRLLLT